MLWLTISPVGKRLYHEGYIARPPDAMPQGENLLREVMWFLQTRSKRCLAEDRGSEKAWNGLMSDSK